MPPIRVLVVDDSIVVRKMVTDVINGDPDLQVVGTARNGIEALARIEELGPDIMTLDIEMPELNGLETLARLRALGTDLPVIMFSTLTVQGSEATLDALTLGARDYVAKPANVGSVTAVVDELERELVPKLKALAGARNPSIERDAAPATSTERTQHGFDKRLRPVRALVVASSTGGPVALEALFSSLTAPLPVPTFIVQHIPPIFSNLLASRLDAHTEATVVEASDGQIVRPGWVYLAPGGCHLRLGRSGADVITRIHDDPPIQHCRPAADALFRSAVEVYGGDLLAVVLTGMGADGRDGAAEICAAGGSVLAQDEATSVVWGMPGAVAESGLANEIIPLDAVAGRVQTWLDRHGPLAKVASR